MDLGFRSPRLDFFKRGEVARDVRLLRNLQEPLKLAVRKRIVEGQAQK